MVSGMGIMPFVKWKQTSEKLEKVLDSIGNQWYSNKSCENNAQESRYPPHLGTSK